MYATLALPSIAGLEAPRQRRVCVRSADDLRKAMQHARHAALTVDASGLDRILRLDAARQLVEVQAATPWSVLVGYLAATVPGLSELTADGGLPATVAEAVTSNAPGPDGRPISAHVEALALVTADGDLRRASRTSNRELFALAVGGQGLFGVAYSVTLRIGSLRDSCAARRPEVEVEPGEQQSQSGTGFTLLLPPEKLDASLERMRAQTADWRVPLVGAAWRPTLSEDETYLCWASRAYARVRLRLATPPGLGGRVRAAQARRELIDTAIAEGGAFTPEEIFYASPAQADACYPQLKAFLAEKRRLDPADRLYNAWYREARGLVRRDQVTVRWG
jgi:FAD binding domain